MHAPQQNPSSQDGKISTVHRGVLRARILSLFTLAPRLAPQRPLQTDAPHDPRLFISTPGTLLSVSRQISVHIRSASPSVYDTPCNKLQAGLNTHKQSAIDDQRTHTPLTTLDFRRSSTSVESEIVFTPGSLPGTASPPTAPADHAHRTTPTKQLQNSHETSRSLSAHLVLVANLSTLTAFLTNAFSQRYHASAWAPPAAHQRTRRLRLDKQVDCTRCEEHVSEDEYLEGHRQTFWGFYDRRHQRTPRCSGQKTPQG